MIRFNKVNKWYGRDHHVLKNISLEVKQGEVVVVCGPSGSGKSTLIRTINQLEPVNDGEIIVYGMEVTDPKTNINAVREEVGFVFQHFNLYPHLTVLENIMLVRSPTPASASTARSCFSAGTDSPVSADSSMRRFVACRICSRRRWWRDSWMQMKTAPPRTMGRLQKSLAAPR